MAQTQNPCKLWQLLLENPDDELVKKQIAEFDIVKFMLHMDACKACFEYGCQFALKRGPDSLDRALDVLQELILDRVSVIDDSDDKVRH